MTDAGTFEPPQASPRPGAWDNGPAGKGRDGGDILSTGEEFRNLAVPVKPRRYLRHESASVAEKLRAGGVIRPWLVRRGTNRRALRFGFSPTDVVHRSILESLAARGIAILGADGAFRHGES